MEIIDPKQKQEFEERRLTSNSGIQSDSSGRVLAGLILLAIGAMLIARKMGFYFPDWLFSWEMLLIAIGSFVGAKNNFRLGGWLVPIFIGVLFLFEEFFGCLGRDHLLKEGIGTTIRFNHADAFNF